VPYSAHGQPRLKDGGTLSLADLPIDEADSADRPLEWEGLQV